MRVTVVVVVIVVVFVKIAFLASEELVGERRRFGRNVRNKAHRNPLDALHVSGDLLPHCIPDGVQFAERVVARGADLDVDEEVLPALDALHASDLGLLAAAVLCHQSCPSCLLHITLDLLVHGHICQFQHGGLGVSPSGLHDHAADRKPSDGIQPSRAGQEMAGRDCQQRDESRETVHAVVVCVAG